MPTLPNMGLITPALKGDSGIWDSKLNAIFGLVDTHNHTVGKGVKVPIAGIDIDTDVAMGGKAITGLQYVAFNAIAALTSGSKTLFVNTADNELYWRNNGGANVKLTAGGTLNITLVGGIVGDYSSVGAEVAFDNANKRYTFKSGGVAPLKWSRMASGPVRIYEYDTTETVYVEQIVAAGLAAPYTVTWAAALPGTQKLVQIDAAGNLVYGNTLANNEDITLQGTGHIKRGEWTDTIPFTPGGDWQIAAGSAPAWKTAGTSPCVNIPVSSTVLYPLKIGDSKNRIKKIVVHGRAFNATCNLRLYFSGTVDGAGVTSISAMNTINGGLTDVAVAADGLMNPRTLTLDNPFVLGGGQMLFLRVEVVAGATNGFDLTSYDVVTDVTT